MDKTIYGLRLDHYLNPSRRIAGRYTWDKTLQGIPNFYDNLAEIQTSDLPFKRHSSFVSYSDALRPNLLVDVRGGFNAYLTQRVTRSLGFDPTKVALPARLAVAQQLLAFALLSLRQARI